MVELPVKMYVQGLAKKAKSVARPLAKCSIQVREKALTAMLDAFNESTDEILDANRQDIERISKDLEAQVYRQAVDRVRITAEDLEKMKKQLEQVVASPDPIGEVPHMWMTQEGMQVSRVRAPLGVVAVISDMPPHVGLEAYGMCLKTGNVCIYRGGTEWLMTNMALVSRLQNAVIEAGLPEGVMTFVDRTEPEAALELVRLTKYVDAVIPKGKSALRKGIMEQSRVPVIGYDGGLSHIYIDGNADIPLAQTIVVNAKVQEPTASNAVDVILIHQKVARHILPGLLRRLLEEFKFPLVGCPKTIAMMGMMEMTGHLGVKVATEKDWSEKFQSQTLSIKVVKDFDEALDHIDQYGPGHTNTIVTRDYDTATRFVHEVDASAVMVNASTRLHNGEEFGLGPEIGMNTTHFHANGPMTLETLTTEKFVVFGTGQLKQPHPVPAAYLDAMMLSSKF